MVRLKVFILVFAFLLVSMSFSQCAFTGNVKNKLIAPAVLYDSHDAGKAIGGEPIEITLYFTDGKGDIIFVGNADVEKDTRISAQRALSIAADQSKIKSDQLSMCDAVITLASVIDPEKRLNVSGPSAGASFYVLFRALFENRTIRKDATLTGYLNTDGTLGRVSGYYEKTFYLPNSIKHFLMPKLSLMEQLILYSFINKNNTVKIYEIYKAEDAYQFFIYNVTLLPKTKFTADPYVIQEQNLKNITELFADLTDFSEMFEEEADNLKEQVKKSYISKELKEYFEKSIAEQEKIKSYGYYYTAGNNLFLLVSEFFIAEVSASDRKINEVLVQKKYDVESCIFATENRGLLVQNVSTVDKYTGITARLFWAKKNIEKTEFSFSREIQLETARDLAYAYGWCEYSKNLLAKLEKNSVLPDTPKKLNVSSLQNVTAKLLSNYNFLNSSLNEDIGKYYSYAYESYLTGDYLASLFNLYFAKSIYDFISHSSRDELSEKLATFSNISFKSYWGKIYATQMYFFMHNQDNLTAVRLGWLAFNMDQMLETIESNAQFYEIIIPRPEKDKDIPVKKTVEYNDILSYRDIQDSIKRLLNILLLFTAFVLVLLIIYSLSQKCLKSTNSKKGLLAVSDKLKNKPHRIKD